MTLRSLAARILKLESGASSGNLARMSDDDLLAAINRSLSERTSVTIARKALSLPLRRDDLHSDLVQELIAELEQLQEQQP